MTTANSDLTEEDRIRKRDEYDKHKEKTVGRTFELKADADAAFATFLQLVDDDEARDFLAKSKAAVLQVFADSGTGRSKATEAVLVGF